MSNVSDEKSQGGLKVTLSNLARKVIPTPIKAMIGRRMTQGIAKKRPTVESTDGRHFKTIEDGLFFRVFYEGIYEPDLTSAFTKYLATDDTILDVGASFGWYTTLFAKHASGGKTIAYEPTPDTFDILEENIVLNKMNESVVCKRLAVGEKEGTISFVRTDNSGLGHVVDENDPNSISVPVITVDSDASEFIGKTALLKVHVEGFELNVLKGSTELLATAPHPVVQVKLTDDRLERYGVSRHDIFDFLKAAGYDLYQLTSGGGAERSDSPTAHEIFGVGQGVYADRFKSIFG